MLAHGVHGMSVVTAVTAQNSVGVQGVWSLPAAAVAAQFRSVVDDIGVDAVKIGMLGTAETCVLVAELLATLPAGAPVVLDPVAVSKHGDPLIDDDAIDAMRTRLFPLATVATPNLDEARTLVGPAADGETDQARLGHALLELGPTWVLVKGGHAEGDPVDVLVGRDAPDLTFAAARDDNAHTHGTGCTLASAIASRLALGSDVPAAVGGAKAYVPARSAAGSRSAPASGPPTTWALRALEAAAHSEDPACDRPRAADRVTSRPWRPARLPHRGLRNTPARGRAKSAVDRKQEPTTSRHRRGHRPARAPGRPRRAPREGAPARPRSRPPRASSVRPRGVARRRGPPGPARPWGWAAGVRAAIGHGARTSTRRCAATGSGCS